MADVATRLSGPSGTAGPFDNLPNELHVAIFAYLDLRSRLALRCVSKRIQASVETASLWQTHQISNNRLKKLVDAKGWFSDTPASSYILGQHRAIQLAQGMIKTLLVEVRTKNYRDDLFIGFLAQLLQTQPNIKIMEVSDHTGYWLRSNIHLAANLESLTVHKIDRFGFLNSNEIESVTLAPSLRELVLNFRVVNPHNLPFDWGIDGQIRTLEMTVPASGPTLTFDVMSLRPFASTLEVLQLTRIQLFNNSSIGITPGQTGFRDLSHLRELIMDHCSLALLGSLPSNLRYLTLNTCTLRLDQTMIDDLKASRLPLIENISLLYNDPEYSMSLGPRELSYILLPHIGVPSLKRLKIHHLSDPVYPGSTSSAVESLTFIHDLLISHGPVLTALSISHPDIKDDTLSLAARFCPNLTCLGLGGSLYVSHVEIEKLLMCIHGSLRDFCTWSLCCYDEDSDTSTAQVARGSLGNLCRRLQIKLVMDADKF